MANIAGCGGDPTAAAKKPSATHPVGVCEDSSAIRVGDYKLIVGQFARCGRNPNKDGAAEDFITQRMCGWWLPMGSAENAQRSAEIAEANELNFNASKHGAMLALAEMEAQAKAQIADINGKAAAAALPAPVLLFNIAEDPNERQDLSTTAAGKPVGAVTPCPVSLQSKTRLDSI